MSIHLFNVNSFSISLPQIKALHTIHKREEHLIVGRVKRLDLGLVAKFFVDAP